jgi:hypothetical protein
MQLAVKENFNKKQKIRSKFKKRIKSEFHEPRTLKDDLLGLPYRQAT